MSVYFIRNKTTGNIKIGYSENPFARHKNLQEHTDCVLWLEASMLWAGLPEEALLLDFFAKTRVRGEWFRPTADLESVIRCAKTDSLAAIRWIPLNGSKGLFEALAVRYATFRRARGWQVSAIASRLGVSVESVRALIPDAWFWECEART